MTARLSRQCKKTSHANPVYRNYAASTQSNIMNPATLALKNRTSTIVLTIILIAAGAFAYTQLGRLEFPNFVIKTAVVVTRYPGASAQQVEEEVTDVLEESIQSMGELKEVHSISQDGLSVIYTEMKDKYASDRDLQQIWDKVRRNISDSQSDLPPGAGPSIVNDDFGDVYGLFYAISGESYSFQELKEYADEIKKDLMNCTDVARIAFWGVQPQVINIDLNQVQMAELGLSPAAVVQLLRSQDTVQPAGNVLVDGAYIRIEPTGDFDSEQQIADLLLTLPGSEKGIRLSDIAEVSRGYLNPPINIMRFNGKPAIGFGISTVAGGNAVTMSDAVKLRMSELEARRPVGIDVDVMYDQGGTVDIAVNDFMVNLISSVAIVVLLLLIFMGWRSGLLIGIVLVLTILATFIYMWLFGYTLQKISLGALVLALGMLVDNAIVVVEGVLIKMKRGIDAETAAVQTVGQTQVPLLGATFIAALAFAAIGLAPGNIGEFCSSLFWVVGSSLLLSWITAVTVTPLLCVWMLKTTDVDESEEVDPYDYLLFRIFRKSLHGIIRLWPISLAALVACIVASGIGFGLVPNSFFPESSQPMFTVNFFRPQGTHIEETSDSVRKIEAFLESEKSVRRVSTFIGQGALRFILTYTPEDINSSYGNLIVFTDDQESMLDVMRRLEAHLKTEFADAEWTIERWKDGPPLKYGVEARFRGPDSTVLRGLGEQAKTILRKADPAMVRDNWRNKTRVFRPEFSEIAARQVGLTRAELASTLQANFGGQTVGVFREGTELLPMIVRTSAAQNDYSSSKEIYARSSTTGQSVALDSIVSNWSNNDWIDPLLHRRDRQLELTVQANPRTGLPSVMLGKVKDDIEAIELPPGYELEWAGELKASADGQAPLAKMFPICLGGMFITLVLLYNGFRQPLIIFLCLPMISIGVTVILLLTGLPFGFMSILGFLGLSGMMIKNAIVLIDEIEFNKALGIAPYTSVLDATVSRLRPVILASGTTVLGMIPLIWDQFYKGMAATVAGGLIGSTILILLVIPLFYVLFFRIKAVETKTS